MAIVLTVFDVIRIIKVHFWQKNNLQFLRSKTIKWNVLDNQLFFPGLEKGHNSICYLKLKSKKMELFTLIEHSGARENNQ